MAELPHISFVQAATNTDLDRALRIDERLFDRPAKRRAVMKARAEIVIARIAMGHSRDKQFPLAAHGYVRGSAGDATEVARADMGTG